MIYLDNAATTPLHPKVIEAMNAAMHNNWGNASSAHAMGRKAKQIVDECHQTVAQYCNALASEVLITGTGTEALNLAIHSMASTWLKKHGAPGTCITSPLEHKSVQETLHNLQQNGWQIITLSLNPDGTINLAELEQYLTTQSIAGVCIQWVNSEVGIIQPIEAIATLTQEYAVPCICDCAQGVPHLPWPTIAPDFCTFTPHKFYGPKGIGILLAKKTQTLYPLIFGGGQEFGYRSGTENTVSMAGTSTAIELLRTERTARKAHNAELQTYLKEHIQSSTYAELTSPNSNCIVATTNITLHNTTAETALMQCDLQGICISTGSACNSGAQELHPTVEALGLTAAEAKRTIRISTNTFTTISDIDALMNVLSKL